MASMEILITRYSSHGLPGRDWLPDGAREGSAKIAVLGCRTTGIFDIAAAIQDFPSRDRSFSLEFALQRARSSPVGLQPTRRPACADKDRSPGRKTARQARRRRSCRRKRSPGCPGLRHRARSRRRLRSPAGRAWNPRAGTAPRPARRYAPRTGSSVTTQAWVMSASTRPLTLTPLRFHGATRSSARKRSTESSPCSSARAARCRASASITTGMPLCGSRATLATKDTGLWASSCFIVALLQAALATGNATVPETIDSAGCAASCLAASAT